MVYVYLEPPPHAPPSLPSLQGGLTTHMREIHPEERKKELEALKCPRCGKIAKNAVGLKSHMRMAHDETVPAAAPAAPTANGEANTPAKKRKKLDEEVAEAEAEVETSPKKKKKKAKRHSLDPADLPASSENNGEEATPAKKKKKKKDKHNKTVA